MKKIDTSEMLYRLSTILTSFKALYRLTPEQVNSFVNSYDIYNYEWIDGKAFDGAKEIKYEEVKQKIIDWYSVLNHLCAIGEVEKMYIPPTLDNTKGILANQVLFERRFADQIGMKGGFHVLELGCGKGRVAAHLAGLTGASITGINIDQGQLDSANQFAKRNGLTEQCQFLNRDINDLPLPFGDNSFDCVYEIQALSLCKDLPKLFNELHRVMRPGAKLSILDWVRLPNYNPDDPHHVDLMRRIKPLIGAIGTPSPTEYEQFLKAAGFEILVSEEPSINHSQDPHVEKASQQYVMIERLIKFLVKIRVFPKHFVILIDRFCQDGDALIEATKKGLVTTSYHLVAQKKAL